MAKTNWAAKEAEFARLRMRWLNMHQQRDLAARINQPQPNPIPTEGDAP